MKLSDGRQFYAKTIISNATRWDTFGEFLKLSLNCLCYCLPRCKLEIVEIMLVGKLLKKESLPEEEKRFQEAYVKAPSFLSIHMGVKADVLPPDTDCHHFILEVWWWFQSR